LRLAQELPQPVEHPRAVEHAVHQHQRGWGRGDGGRSNMLYSRALQTGLAGKGGGIPARGEHGAP
jgi:hypothetical protein